MRTTQTQMHQRCWTNRAQKHLAKIHPTQSWQRKKRHLQSQKKARSRHPKRSNRLGNFVVPSQSFRILIFENDFQFHFRILIFENVFEFHFRILIFDSRLLVLENRRKIKNDHDQGTGENPYAVALLNWKARYLIKNVRIKSSWLRGKLQLTKIPSARPLNVAHVNVLRLRADWVREP